jgi:sulfite dehydrogenase (quinone) subunit SoeC
MHPSFSIILFTVSSGAGYGLLALFGLFIALGLVPADAFLGLSALLLALGLVSIGLLSSTAHLGRPERAWRALSQWRSSWLSREGIAALATYVPALLLALALVTGAGAGMALLGLLAAATAAATVYCTAMIYRSLKPIHQWHNAHVVPNYLALALATGALWLNALGHLWNEPSTVAGIVTLLAVALACFLKLRYWRFIHETTSRSTIASATGLGAMGSIRMLDPPHTEENYLLKEMGYRIARKHATRLRSIALGAAFIAPFILTLPTLFGAGIAITVLAVAALALGMLGVFIERWLFFAEAKHTVQLYYGAATV